MPGYSILQKMSLEQHEKMRTIHLTKQAAKKLKQLKKSNPKIATAIKDKILLLANCAESVEAENLQGFTDFKKLRVSKYRIIYIFDTTTVTIALVEKRETVYETFVHLINNSNFLDNI